MRRFYDLGFNIEATAGHRQLPQRATASAPACRAKISEGSEEILESLRQGHVTYVINTWDANEWANDRTAMPSAAARWRTT